MEKPTQQTVPVAERFTRRISELREKLTGFDPYRLAEMTGASYQPIEGDKGEFSLLLWDRPVMVFFPDLSIFQSPSFEPVSPINQALLLYYFTTADGTPPSGEWISFSELPDGRFYNQAFQGYTGHELSKFFQNDHPSFEQAARLLGGTPQNLGDSSFSFKVLPRVDLLVVYWQGDEDIPASFQILFDASAKNYLPTDAYAILGSKLTQRLLAARSK